MHLMILVVCICFYGSISLANSGTLTLGAIDTGGEFSISSSGGLV